jgi:hypothetical protein
MSTYRQQQATYPFQSSFQIIFVFSKMLLNIFNGKYSLLATLPADPKRAYPSTVLGVFAASVKKRVSR